jgi:hypothetical protein
MVTPPHVGLPSVSTGNRYQFQSEIAARIELGGYFYAAYKDDIRWISKH